MNYFKLFLVLFFSLTLTLIVSGSFFKLWIEDDVRQASVAASDALEAMNLKLKNERLKQERIDMVNSNKRRQANEKRKAEQRAAISIQKTNQETCNFWRSKYIEDKSDKSKSFMQSSCKRASKLFN